MQVIIILIAISVSVAVIFLFAFIWAVKTGQFEDDHTPAIRILFDDAKPEPNHKDKSKS